MTSELHIAQARLATQRAHLAGAEAAELEALVARWEKSARRRALTDPPVGRKGDFADLLIAASKARAEADAARRRYWREIASASLLIGHRWESAERLGVEP